jgi:nucleoside-diphosphate-sugar epimerase
VSAILAVLPDRLHVLDFGRFNTITEELVMALSFTPSQPLGDESGARSKVLVTGASGNIGSYFAEHAHRKYELRLMVREMNEDAEKLAGYGGVVSGDLADLPLLTKFCEGVDTVLHLAASAGPNSVWETQVLPNNIVGVYNVYAAAKAAGVRRVIFASSIHAVSGYPKDVQVKTTDPVNPGDLYGVSKCFGEALGRYMAEQEGISSIALRIGAFQPIAEAKKDENVGMLDAFVSRRDLQQLIEKCIDVENIKFAIFNGLSDNRFKRLDISDARDLLGYAPQDDMTEEMPGIKKLKLGEKVMAHSKRDKSQESGLRETLMGLKSGKGSPEHRGNKGRRARGKTGDNVHKLRGNKLPK